MKIAVPFALGQSAIDDADELNITFKSDSSMEKLLDFLAEYQEKQVNVLFESQAALGKANLSLLGKVHPLVSIVIPCYDDEIFRKLREEAFDCGLFCLQPACCLLDLERYFQSGATQAYISGDLPHRMPEVDQLANRYGASLRLILDSCTDPELGYRAMWFRPQDMPLLSEHYASGEFTGAWDARHYKWERHRALCKAFFSKQSWVGELSEVNVDCGIPYPCDAFFPTFLARKMRCGLKCVSYPGSCHSCKSHADSALLLHDKGMRVKPTKQP